MRRIVGIDPGLAGGAALIDVDDAGAIAAVGLWRTPTIPVQRGRVMRREYDLASMRAWLDGARGATLVPHVALELQNARPGQGVVSMYRTGLGFGVWLGLTVGLGFSFSTVSPAAWKRFYGLAGKDKRASRLRAQELLPKWGPILPAEEGCAEAALLALYLIATARAPALAEGWDA